MRPGEIAIEGLARPQWRDIVLEDAPGGQRMNERRRVEPASQVTTSPHPASQAGRFVARQQRFGMRWRRNA